jgi:hypothetical protein
MKPSELKKLIVSSLDADTDTGKIADILEKEGISFDFRNDFNNKVLDLVFSASRKISNEVEFVKSMNFVFKRIALSGIAAILILLLSIFFMEGSLSFNSFLGLTDSYDESIVCLLTGN